MRSSQPVGSGLRALATVMTFLSVLVMTLEVSSFHHHRSREAALYDQECPAMQLAACAGDLGLDVRPLVDLGAAPLALDTVAVSPLSIVLSITARPAGARAPPLFA